MQNKLITWPQKSFFLFGIKVFIFSAYFERVVEKDSLRAILRL
ncbi:hypothetical protein LEP1GSC062_2674 [Leptospira alexanderi serovar Manhao 3 str. L 60]|uniref:Uncharacterized protein n=1 Tax=Leptospira alexanderi serovar Manhao 3 str. L 60 TaxID=1049759 RepID=V6HUV4_9LEPT|nr:hypothetical protein LEP1GSC062_2674 [Leptospira alexanderi serovar Manhao 3 str. L 60]